MGPKSNNECLYKRREWEKMDFLTLLSYTNDDNDDNGANINTQRKLLSFSPLMILTTT